MFDFLVSTVRRSRTDSLLDEYCEINVAERKTHKSPIEFHFSFSLVPGNDVRNNPIRTRRDDAVAIVLRHLRNAEMQTRKERRATLTVRI